MTRLKFPYIFFVIYTLVLAIAYFITFTHSEPKIKIQPYIKMEVFNVQKADIKNLKRLPVLLINRCTKTTSDTLRIKLSVFDALGRVSYSLDFIPTRVNIPKAYFDK